MDFCSVQGRGVSWAHKFPNRFGRQSPATSRAGYLGRTFAMHTPTLPNLREIRTLYAKSALGAGTRKSQLPSSIVGRSRWLRSISPGCCLQGKDSTPMGHGERGEVLFAPFGKVLYLFDTHYTRASDLRTQSLFHAAPRSNEGQLSHMLSGSRFAHVLMLFSHHFGPQQVVRSIVCMADPSIGIGR